MNAQPASKIEPPRAYVARLNGTDQPAGAHVFAVARYCSDGQATEELREVVEPYGAAWQPPTPLTLEDERAKSAELQDVFLGTHLSRHRWDEADSVARFTEQHRPTLFAVIGSEIWFGDPPEWPEGYAAICRKSRAVVVVDLDHRRMSTAAMLAYQSLPLVLRPTHANDVIIESCHALQWDSANGSFRSAKDTRAQWRNERDNEGAQLARRLVNSRRWPFLLRELGNRLASSAELGPTTVEEAVREEVRRALIGIDVSKQATSLIAEAMLMATGCPEDPFAVVRERFPQQLRGFRRKLANDLANYLTEAVYPGTRWSVESKQNEITESELPAHFDFRDRAAGHAEEAFLGPLIAEEMECQLRRELTPAQREVLDCCLLGGESEVEFARRKGLSAGGIRATVFAIRRKARAVL